LVTGGATKGIIELLGMDCVEGTEENVESAVDLLYGRMEKSKKPSVLLLKRNWAKEISCSGLKDAQKKNGLYSMRDLRKPGQIIDFRNGKNSAREDAIDAIVYSLSEKDAVFSGTGLMSRSIYERYDSENKFYVAGSFGLVSSVGLGFASVQKNTKSIVIDGDSSILTNFGSLVSIAKENPKNLVHIILDNNSYASCSEERSCSDNARIPEIASCLGYNVCLADSSYSIALALKECASSENLSMVYAYTKLAGRRDFKRPLDLSQISGRFRNYFSGVEP
jgi:sulfopyruvate decarboxylase subunit beta